MFDVRDLYALPIAFSLTLWDAFPLYVSLGLALAILSSALLNEQAHRNVWRFREVVGVEGLLYLAIFRPSLIPALLLVAGIAMVVVVAQVTSPHTALRSPGAAMKERFGEILAPLLAACAVAAIIKVFAPAIPEGLAIQSAIALGGSILISNKSGTGAIPAVAIAVHLGGLVPATVWIIRSSARVLLDHLRQANRRNATTRA